MYLCENRMTQEEFQTAVLGKLSEFDKNFVAIGLRLDKIDNRLDKVENRFDKVEFRLEKIEDRLDKVEFRLEKIEDRLRKIELFVPTENADFHPAGKKHKAA